MIRSIALAFFSLCITPAIAQHEVMYHISNRSFFDSNGDGQGDLKGIEQKLDYLQQFGITTISLSPVYQSDFYHNLYATDLEKIDAEYGAFKEYRDLVQNIHLRKMKIYQEIDLQYVSTKHLWFTDSSKNTKSAYSSYIYYTDAKNEKPYLLPDIMTYDGSQAAAVNLKNAKVATYYNKALKYWVDPDGDGNFYDGVDGFRLVDVKDKLDNSGKTGNQLKEFYAPLVASLKKINPALQLLAEPVDKTSAGNELFTKAGFDRVLASQLRDAIVSFDKQKIMKAADSILLHYDYKARVPVLYIEGENTERTASIQGMNIGKLKAAAGLSFLLGGVPCIYYGQEIGMMGVPKKMGADLDYIPVREAYEWYASNEGTGMATWYKGAGQLWDNRFAKPTDGISLEEQQKAENSLWAYYKQLIRMKKMVYPIAEGKYENVLNSNDKVVSFVRNDGKHKYFIMINLSDKQEHARLDNGANVVVEGMQLVFGTPNVAFGRGARDVSLTPYCVQVWKCIYQ